MSRKMFSIVVIEIFQFLEAEAIEHHAQGVHLVRFSFFFAEALELRIFLWRKELRAQQEVKAMVSSILSPVLAVPELSNQYTFSALLLPHGISVLKNDSNVLPCPWSGR